MMSSKEMTLKQKQQQMEQQVRKRDQDLQKYS